MEEQEDVPRPAALLESIQLPVKTLLGPGPSNIPPSVTLAGSQPLVGHLHPECLKVMDDIKLGLQYAFQTRNTMTLAMSSTGHGGMETCLSNLLEPGDIALVLVTGIWGERAADMAQRYGADVRRLERPAGENVSTADIDAALAQHRPVLLFVTHGESSTGVLQPLDELGPLCRKYDCLLVVDAVASLGGAPLYTDRWQLDAVYTGSQKVLGAPPGLAPLTMSPRACAKIAARKKPPTVFYFDLNLVGNYWGCDEGPRRYHHTAPVSLLYTLREALSLLVREGLPACLARHAEATRLLHSGVAPLGIHCFVEKPEARLPTISSLVLPAGANILQLQQHAMKNHSVEVAGGLGPTAGKIVRLGLMGMNATPRHAELALQVFREALEAQGLPAVTDSAKL